MPDSNQQEKSPLVFLSILAVLVVSTLVVASSYFLKPNIEAELKSRLTSNFLMAGVNNTDIKISGRDVTLTGVVATQLEATKAENIAKQLSGVHDVNNQLLINN